MGFREEIRILHGRIEGGAQRREPIRRNAGRRANGRAMPWRDTISLRAARCAGSCGQIHDQGHACISVLALLQRDLQDDVDLLAVSIALLRLSSWSRTSRSGRDFVALHRQRDLGAARISGHDLIGMWNMLRNTVGEDVAFRAPADAPIT